MTRGIIKAAPGFGLAFFDGIDKITPTGAAHPGTTRPWIAASRADAARRATREIIGVPPAVHQPPCAAASGEIPRRGGLFEIVRPAGAVSREVGGAPAEATAPA